MLSLEDQFQEFAVILGLAAAFGILGTVLRQPLIAAFIAVGIAAGPAWLDVAQGDELELLANIGIALLLFVVGLKLDLDVIRTMGRVAVLTGVGQIVFTSTAGFALTLLLGFDAVASLYIAVALTFSSTIIIVKLLSDKREIDSLHGRIAVGFLIVQDLAVIVVMIVISAFDGGNGGDTNPLLESVLVFARGGALLAGVAAVGRWVIPGVIHVLARSGELLLLTAIAWAIALAVTSDAIGLSKEVGAFLAGVSLASTPYREVISGRLTSLRDFLLLFFFVDLGANLDLSGAADQVLPAVILSLFVLIGNPIIVLAIMGAMGYRKRTGFLAGLAVAQISEFSLIFAALGLSLGHVDEEVVTLVTLVGLITIGLSTYMILYSQQIYDRIGRWLQPFERDVHHPEDEEVASTTPHDVIIYGMGRYGGAVAEGLSERGMRVLGIDFDPEIVQQARERGLDVRYGDAEDAEFLQLLPLEQARLVVCSVPEIQVNLALLRELRMARYSGRIAVTVRSEADAAIVAKAAPDIVLRPFADAAAEAVDLLSDTGSRSVFTQRTERPRPLPEL